MYACLPFNIWAVLQAGGASIPWSPQGIVDMGGDASDTAFPLADLVAEAGLAVGLAARGQGKNEEQG